MNPIEVCLSGNLEEIKKLIQEGNCDKDTVLRYAVEYRQLDIVKCLVELGADIHALSEGALRCAVEGGRLDVVKYLVEQGADVHVNNEEALRHASYNGDEEMVEYLVEQGADIHACNEEALKWAICFDHLHIAKYLIKKGANIYNLQLDNNVIVNLISKLDEEELLPFLLTDNISIRGAAKNRLEEITGKRLKTPLNRPKTPYKPLL
jgi:ankyrin repeat protein